MSETDCFRADRCVFDTKCNGYLRCSDVDPRGLELQELADYVASLEKRITALEARNN